MSPLLSVNLASNTNKSVKRLRNPQAWPKAAGRKLSQALGFYPLDHSDGAGTVRPEAGGL